MIATAVSAFVFLAAVQCLLVVHVADKLSPRTSDDRAGQAKGSAQYA